MGLHDKVASLEANWEKASTDSLPQAPYDSSVTRVTHIQPVHGIWHHWPHASSLQQLGQHNLKEETPAK